MDPLPGFHDLLARARTGEHTAVDELLVRIRPWLEHLARSAGQPRQADASISDLVQEAWLKAWQKLDQFQGADDEAQALAMFRAWLARIVARINLNQVRDRCARQRLPPGKLLRLNGPIATASGSSSAAAEVSAGEPTPSANAQAAEQARLVQEALAKLSDPLDREIVRLRFFEGISLRQIAEQIGHNHETVRQRYHAVLQRLHGQLGALG